MSHQKSLCDFLTTSSSISSGTDNTDEAITSDQESGKLETEGDHNFDGLPASKRRKRGNGRKHGRSGFDPKWTQEFKWLEKVEVDGRSGMLCNCARNMAKYMYLGTGREVGAQSPVLPLRYKPLHYK